MYQLFKLNEDGSKLLIESFDTEADAQTASSMIDGGYSIEMKTETGSIVLY